MTQGVLLGLLAQMAFAIGFTLIGIADTFRNTVVKTSLAIVMASVICLVTLIILRGQTDFHAVSAKHWVYVSIGAVVALFIGETLFITGIAKSNVTAVAYTALAYPVMSLAVESALGRASLTLRDGVGFVFLCIGFIIIVSRKSLS